MGCMLWLGLRLATSCLVMRRRVCRESASPDLGLSGARGQRVLAEVGVCVAPEPHELGEGSSNVCVMGVACTVVGLVTAVGRWSRFYGLESCQ